MAKISLSPLTLRFHEPDHDVLLSSSNAVRDNVAWELDNVRVARDTAVGGSRVALAARERALSSMLKSANRDMQLLNDWRVELNPYVDPIEVGQLYQHRATHPRCRKTADDPLYVLLSDIWRQYLRCSRGNA